MKANDIEPSVHRAGGAVPQAQRAPEESLAGPLLHRAVTAPRTLSYRDVQRLQRAIGNTAVQRMLKQPTLDNWMPGGRKHPSSSGGAGGDDRPPWKWAPEKPDKIFFDDEDVEIEGDEGEFTARTRNGEHLGSLTLYWDEPHGIYWVNNIGVEPGARRRGIAMRLLQAATQAHGRIYFSTQDAEQDDEADTRHMTAEGYGLALAASGRLNVVIASPDDPFGHGADEEQDGSQGSGADMETS